MMKTQVQFILLTLAMLSVVGTYSQQDAMFTRYVFINHMHANPAAAGRQEGLRLSAAYRNQWANVVGSPTTFAFSIEKPMSSNKAGIGINIFHDRVGFDRHTGIHGNYSYKIPLSHDWSIAVGLKAGISILNSSFIDAITPDPGIDPLHTNPYHKTIARAGTGLLFTNQKSYIGLSAPNIISWFENDVLIKDTDVFLSKHAYATVGHVIGDENADIQFKPSVFVRYHPAAPVQFDFNVMAWYQNRIAFGLGYRTGDAILGMLDVALTPELTISYAYDYTASDFRQIGAGAHELIMYYTMTKKDISVPSIHKFSTMPKF